MRIRLSTTLPLPPLKAWYLFPPSVETIADLKAELVAELPAFRGIKPRLLAFEVDGFEVLDASRCEVLNEERDVLCIKIHDSPASTSTKRKKSHSEAPSAAEPASSSSSRKKRKLSAPPTILPPTKKAKSVPPSPVLEPVKLRKKKSAAAILAPAPPPPPPPPPAPVAVARRKSARADPPSSSLDSSMSDSSDSDSDDESESSATSSSSSDSDSSSSSSGSSSAPEASSSKLIPTGRAPPVVSSASIKGKGKEVASTAIRLTPIIPDQPPVPPGQGLSATHERNVRRRKKKAALKLERAFGQTSAVPSSSAVSAPPSSSTPSKSVAPTPTSMPPLAMPSPSPFLSSAASTSTSTSNDIPPLPFLANSNRNKKRDFKKAMATAVGQKTVFAQPDVPIYSAVPPPPPPPPATPARVESLQATSTPTSGSGKRPYQHVLAPSERTSLPKGMFVTSVDVETQEWEAAQGWGLEEVEPKQKQMAKEKGTTKNGGEGGGGEGGKKGGDRKGREEDGADGSREWADYIRGEEQATSAGAPVEAEGQKEVDWATVDAAFEVATPVTAVEQLQVGSRVGWKELILSPLTYTPELSVLVGTVVALSSTSISLQMIDRPLPASEEEDDQAMWDEDGHQASTNHEVDPVEPELRVVGVEEAMRAGWKLL